MLICSVWLLQVKSSSNTNADDTLGEGMLAEEGHEDTASV